MRTSWYAGSAETVCPSIFAGPSVSQASSPWLFSRRGFVTRAASSRSFGSWGKGCQDLAQQDAYTQTPVAHPASMYAVTDTRRMCSVMVHTPFAARSARLPACFAFTIYSLIAAPALAQRVPLAEQLRDSRACCASWGPTGVWAPKKHRQAHEVWHSGWPLGRAT